MPKTADALLTDIRLECYWDSTNSPLTDAELLSLADKEIVGRMFPELVRAYGDRYTASEDYNITNAQAKYRLPDRMYGPVKDVGYVDSDGEFTSIPFMEAEDLGRTSKIGGNRTGFRHYFDGDFVGLDPEPTSTQDTLRVKFYRHPSVLVLLAAATTISSLDLSSLPLQIIVTANPNSWAANQKLDIISAKSDRQTLLVGQVIVTVTTSTTLDMADSMAGSGIAAGDYVAEEGETSIVQVPDAMIPLLVQRVAARALRIKGETKAAAEHAREAKELHTIARAAIKPRSEAEATVMVGRNSPFRGRRR